MRPDAAGPSAPTGPRYHALDALRAAMMALGLVLHAACNYMALPANPAWPFRDRHTSFIFDVLVVLVHEFRLPVFFVMAGFFAALLYQRRGPEGLLVNRTRRVLLPLVLFWPPLFALVSTGFGFALWGGTWQAAGQAVDSLLTGAVLAHANLMHLWFLYDLFLLYLAAVALAVLVGCLPQAWRSTVLAFFSRQAFTVWGVALLVLVTALPLSLMPVAVLESSASLLPPPRILAAYGLFFAFGWLTFLTPGAVDHLGKRSWLYLGLAAPLFVVLLALLGRPTGLGGASWTQAVVSAALIWLLVLGLIGLFVRHAGRPTRLGRYLADASYWLYLVHLPVIIWTAGFLGPYDLPAAVKFLLTLGVTTAFGLATYHVLVRPTWLGVLLNGRRYPRPIPHEEHARRAG